VRHMLVAAGGCEKVVEQALGILIPAKLGLSQHEQRTRRVDIAVGGWYYRCSSNGS